jgi:hypothetical protein
VNLILSDYLAFPIRDWERDILEKV